MQKTPFILATVLVAGLSFAQSDSVESILNELTDYQGAETAPVAKIELPAEDLPAAEPVADVADVPAAEIDIPAVINESRELYALGEFEKAQAGFGSIIKIAPENLVARMYLRKILERDARSTEISAMDAVSAAWNTDLVLRSYDISDSAIEKMELEETDSAIDLTAKFPEVDFPEGASAVYKPRLEKIFVRNTRDNLTVLEEILDAMDIANLSADVEQVEIEAKFVEISEGTLEELGFDWDMSADPTGLFDDVEVLSTDWQAYPVPGGSWPASATASWDKNLFGEALRSMPFEALPVGAGTTAASGNWRSLVFEDTFSDTASTLNLEFTGGTPWDILIRALDQSSGADVLSAPRVVTRSGEEAIIRVGEKHYYPEVYEPDAGAAVITHVVYEDWEEKLLGVELTVTPQVDGDQIEMELNPTILELQGWQTYKIAPANSAYGSYRQNDNNDYSHAAIEARLPVFRKRTIETEVTIADGATMAMGGLINEKVEAFEDKVPVLGSLPLVGRLFRSEGERAVKRNLMMFVTAKKVGPTGRINSTRSFD